MNAHETKGPAFLLGEARRRSYEERLQLLGPRPAVSITFGGDMRRGLQLLLSSDGGTGDHYVYLHRGIVDEVFYVGKGKGDRAYSRDRDPLWHHYLETRCNGQYTVEIVRRYETEDEAISHESDLIAVFGHGIVNRINPSRQMNYAAFAQFHRLRKANWALIATAAQNVSTSPEKAEAGFRQAIANLADYARLQLETGLFAELSSEVFSNADCHLNGGDLAALDRLTLLLKSQGRRTEVASVTSEFFTLYPETREQAIAKRVLKRSR